MRRIFIIFLAIALGVLWLSQNSYASDPAQGVSIKSEETETVEEGGVTPISDPLQKYNRAFFKFNDKLYFWALKPVARGYGKVVPRRARLSVQNFFENVYAPVRIINCSLQCEFKEASIELSRFGVNTTLGVAGLFDPAKNWLHLSPPDKEDTGQTLGFYSQGSGFYLNLPFAGSTSFRDGIGSLIDMCIVPSIYVLINYSSYYITAAKIFEAINRTSLHLGEYEELKRAALDPYLAVRDAYNQHREDLIKR
ncbi:MAG: VacJ family lipoprotein [Desulfobacterota bacterium]|nr:VacJ family lipoprotein [Thermodesulfobacteriota bacterium]